MDWNLIVGANDPSLGVEAYTASWIEIFISRWWCIAPRVEAYTASWIEIDKLYFFISFTSSRLIQPRGLKSICIRWCWETCSRGLYSLVDWNFQSWQCEKRIPRRGLYSLVDWNDGSVWLIASAICRGLYSLVDWNITCCPPPLRFSCRGLYSLVDWNPCVSINTVNPCSSRLIQPRGLKWLRRQMQKV